MAGQAAKLINGLNACSQCPAGQFRGPLSAPTGCLSCDAGKFQHLSGLHVWTALQGRLTRAAAMSPLAVQKHVGIAR